MTDWHTEAVRYDGVWVLKDEAEDKIQAALDRFVGGEPLSADDIMALSPLAFRREQPREQGADDPDYDGPSDAQRANGHGVEGGIAYKPDPESF